MTQKQTLLIHWVREAKNRSKSFDSMRVSANIERLAEPAILFLDEPNPFLIRGFPVLINALSPKKLKEFRFLVDYSLAETEAWKKGFERGLTFLKEKKLPYRICDSSTPLSFENELLVFRSSLLESDECDIPQAFLERGSDGN